MGYPSLLRRTDGLRRGSCAEQGPGNLLGNLLCAIAGLLDTGGPLQGLLQGVAQLLNQLLRGLR